MHALTVLGECPGSLQSYKAVRETDEGGRWRREVALVIGTKVKKSCSK